jgi:hypothetical protein
MALGGTALGRMALGAMALRPMALSAMALGAMALGRTAEVTHDCYAQREATPLFHSKVGSTLWPSGIDHWLPVHRRPPAQSSAAGSLRTQSKP